MFIKKTGQRYEAVFFDLFVGENPPYYMFSQEAFSELKEIITPDGILLIHSTLAPNLDDLFFNSMVKTLLQVFDKVKAASLQEGGSIDIVYCGSDSAEELIDWSGFYLIDIKSDYLAQAEIVTDDYNLMEKYFLPHILEARQARINLGVEVLFAR